jgi:hypothetical protein
VISAVLLPAGLMLTWLSQPLTWYVLLSVLALGSTVVSTLPDLL